MWPFDVKLRGGASATAGGLRRRPWVMSGVFAAGYMATCTVYIWKSDEMLGRLSISKERMVEIAQTKGYLFVFATSLLLFACMGLLLRQILRREEWMQRQQEAVLLAEQRAAAGLFASSIAHDMNNMLAVCLAEVETLAEPTGGAQKEALANLGRACDNLAALARRLMNLGKNATSSPAGEVDMERECRELAALAKTHRNCRSCAISLEIEPGLRFRANAALLKQALLNLFLNAAEATEGRGRILLRVKREGNSIGVEMHDNGPGVSAEVREKIFSAFYSTKKGGMGLGLLSVKACAEVHGGSIAIDGSPLGGALFRMTLPVDGPPSAAAAVVG